MSAANKSIFSSKWIWAAGVSIIATIVCGVVGWTGQGKNALEALYRAGLAFGFSDAYRSDVEDYPALLQVTRWLGVATFIMLAGWVSFALLGENWIKFRAQLAESTKLIVGRNNFCKIAADELLPKHGKFLVHLGARHHEKQKRRILLPHDWLSGENRIFQTLVKKADRILIAEASDAEALSVSRRVLDRVKKSAVVTLLLRNPVIAEDVANRTEDARLRVLSTASLAVRSAHLEHAPFWEPFTPVDGAVSALIVGFGDVGQAVARDLAVNCRTVNLGVPRISVVDPETERKKAALRLRVPELDKTGHFSFVCGGFGPQDAPPTLCEENGKPKTEFTAAWLCVEDPSEAIASLGNLRAWLRKRGQPHCPIFVYSEDPGLIQSVEGRIIVFGKAAEIVQLSGAFDTTIDEIAKAFHQAYLDRLTVDKVKEKRSQGDKSVEEWPNLPQKYRNSNRAAVEHLPAKLASVGTDPATSDMQSLKDAADKFRQADSSEALARLEHERYMAERRWSGWKYGNPRKDDLLEHPDLVSWEQLSDGSRSYDETLVSEAASVLRKGLSRSR